MMRETRSTIRIFEDEIEECAQAIMSETPSSERAPLVDITNNPSVWNETLDDLVIDTMVKVDPKITPRVTKIDDMAGLDEPVEVLEDDDQSEASSAAEEACRDLLQPVMGPEVYRLQVRHPDKVKSPASKAVTRARKDLRPKPLTPRFNPDIHKGPKVVRSPTRAQCKNEKKRDSFLDDIVFKSHAKTPRSGQHAPLKAQAADKKAAEEKAKSTSETAADMDTPSDTPSGSPPGIDRLRKRRSRIEDSFDALDAMEDMLDEVKESLACVDRPRTASSSHPGFPRHLLIKKMQENVSKSAPQTPRGRSIENPVKSKTQERVPLRIASDGPNLLRRTGSTRSLGNAKAAVGGNNSRARPTDCKPARSASKSVDLSDKPRPVVPSTKTKPAAPVKSSKPPTAPTFTLPGEIVSARIKAQREARQARASNATADTNAPKPTRPVANATSERAEKRRSLGPEVRMTAAALGRLQLAQGEKHTPEQRTRQVTTSHPSEPVRSRAPVTRAMAPTLSTAARTTATRNTASTAKAVPTAAQSTRSTTAVPPGKSAAQTGEANPPLKRSGRPISGVYGVKVESGLKRTPSTRSMSGQPVAKKPATETAKLSSADRAEAARRARAEAAERGRQASKEWAERTKKRSSIILNEGVADA